MNEADVEAKPFYVTTPDCYIVDRDDLEMWILHKIGVFCWNDNTRTHALHDNEMEHATDVGVENGALYNILPNKPTLDKMIQCPSSVMQLDNTIAHCDLMRSIDSTETVIEDATNPANKVKKKLDSYTEDLKLASELISSSSAYTT